MKTTLRRSLVTVGLGSALLAGGAITAGTAQAADTGIPVLEAIKQCESGGDYTAVNASSGASGAYQFLDSTWQSMDAASGYSTAASAPESVQDAAAIELYEAQGTTPWAASQSCWSGASVSETTSTDSTSTTETSSDASTSTASTSTATAQAPAADEAPAQGERPEGPRPDGAPRAGQGAPAGAPAAGDNCPR